MSSGIIAMPKSTPYWIEPALWQMSVISMIGVVLMYTGIGEASVVMVLLGFGSFTILTILGKVMYGYNLKARTAMLANMAVISALHLAASIVIVVKLSDVFAPSGFSSRDAFLGVATSTLLIYSIFGSIYFCVYYISLGFTILSLLMSSAVFWIPRIHVAQPVEIKEEYISA